MTGKFSLRYIGSYPITQRVREVAYKLELSPELPRVPNVFHVSQLRKYISDPSYIIEPDLIQLSKKTYHMRNILCRFWIDGKSTFARRWCPYSRSSGPITKCQKQLGNQNRRCETNIPTYFYK